MRPPKLKGRGMGTDDAITSDSWLMVAHLFGSTLVSTVLLRKGDDSVFVAYIWA